MENVKVHVENFDQDTNSLIVYFSGSEGESVFKTQSYAFQTHNYDAESVDDLINKLAVIGKSYLIQEKQKLNFSQNESLIDQLKNIQNTEFEVNVPDPPPPIDNGQIVDDLEVII